MILPTDITMHGFSESQTATSAIVKHFESDKKAEDGVRPAWVIEHKFYAADRSVSLIKIIQNVKKGQSWFQRIRFDGLVSSPKEISWLLNAVKYFNKHKS